MKMKITSVGIIGMFLLCTISTVSAIQTEKVNTMNNDNYDLTIEILSLKASAIITNPFTGEKGGYILNVRVKNMLESSVISKEDYLDFTYLNQIEDKDGNVLHESLCLVDVTGKRLPLEPGDYIDSKSIFYYDWFPQMKEGTVLRVIVDPPDEIYGENGYFDESDETNNDDTIDVPAQKKVKTINPLFNNVLTRLLDNHPNMFPLLRVLLGL